VGVTTDKKLTTLKSSTLWFWTLPTMTGLAIEIIVILCLLAIAYLLRLTKIRREWIKIHWVKHSLTEQTDIVTLANEYDVSWKLLAQVNQLKPPYTLKKGDVLKVPPRHSSPVHELKIPKVTKRVKK
jgi:hypothetical protein